MMNRITKEDGPPTGQRPHSDDLKLNNCDSAPMKVDKKATTNESNKRNLKTKKDHQAAQKKINNDTKVINYDSSLMTPLRKAKARPRKQ